jgi:ketosteroid isomerase-like protein
MAANLESFHIEATEFIPAGDHVVVPHTTHIRAREGMEVRARTTWVATIRDGKLAGVRLFQERAEALESVGLGE